MRTSLFYDPRVLIERLAVVFHRRRRRRCLRGTPAARLELGHLDSLELLQLLEPAPPAVIYDVGANVGTWTCLAKSLFPASRVECFEPLAVHQPEFRRWTKNLAGVTLHPVALGAAAAALPMNVMDFSDASSLLPPTPAANEAWRIRTVRRETVPVASLDHYRREHDLPAPDLFKLDVQGYELAVLQGAEESLRRTRWVLTEVSFREFYRGQPLFNEIAGHLASRGFALCALGINTPLGATLDQTDALFVRPDCLPIS